MLDIKKIIAIAFLAVVLCPMAVLAEAKPVELYFFEGQGCPHCAKMKSYLEGLKADYPNLAVKDFEVYFNKENQDLLGKMLAAHGSDVNGVPVLFIGNEVIVGEDYEKLKNAVDKCSEEGCPSPADKLKDANSNVNTNFETTNTAQPVSSGSNKNEVVGWVVISLFSAAGIGFIIYILKARQ